MPKPNRETRNFLIAIKSGKTQRATCTALGLDDSWRGTIHRILHRIDVSTNKENEVRRRLGLPPIAPPQIPVTPCPSCAARGIIISHGDKLDCHGNGDGPVVVLAPGETVRKPAPQRQRPRVRRLWMGAERTAKLDAAGVTDDIVRRWVDEGIERELVGRMPGISATPRDNELLSREEGGE